MDIDLNAVAAFVRVVEARSFRAAARVLGMPKSTVSLKVSQLEERLGVRLLERTTRRLRLTDAGAAYHRQVLPALEAVRDGERLIAGLSAEPSGRLRVTAPLEFGGLILGDVLPEYLRLYPKVEVQTELTDRQVDLIDEGFDLAIRVGPLADSSLIARKLGTPKQMRFYASLDYLRRRGTPRHPKDLVRHDCLVMTGHRQPATWQFRDGRKINSVEVRPRAAANSFRVLHALALAGHGIARLPELDERVTGSAKGLRTILDEYCLPPVSWHAVYPSARNLPPKVGALLDLLDARFDGASRAGPQPRVRSPRHRRRDRQPPPDARTRTSATR